MRQDFAVEKSGHQNRLLKGTLTFCRILQCSIYHFLALISPPISFYWHLCHSTVVTCLKRSQQRYEEYVGWRSKCYFSLCFRDKAANSATGKFPGINILQNLNDNYVYLKMNAKTKPRKFSSREKTQEDRKCASENVEV